MFYYQLTRTMMHETIAKFGEREQNQKNSSERTPH